MKRVLVLAGLFCLLPLTACGGGHVVTVFADDSMAPAANALAKAFEAEHSDDTVTVVTGDPTDLASRALNGDPGDLLITADYPSLARANTVFDGEAVSFGVDDLVMVVASGSTVTLDDVRNGSASIATCQSILTCGDAWRTYAKSQHIKATPAQSSLSPASVVAAVTSGKAQAAFVFATDAAAAGDQVTVITLPDVSGVSRRPGGAVLKQSGDAALAHDFLDLATSTEGQKILSAAGVQTQG